MKIFCHVPREDWIVDRMGLEFKEHSSHNVSFTNIEEDTDLIWLLGSWCWNQIPQSILSRFKVACTIHHEVPWKFDQARLNNFLLRDKFVDYYLTYTSETKKLIEKYSQKPVKIIPHWINTKIWKSLDKHAAREDLGLSSEKFLIGSFQRDTEGSDLKTPKLEKGPDVFIDKVVEISEFKDVHVILAGWRRQFVINKLKEHNIPYTYFELPDNETINKLYNSLDLYIVSSRCEGGPQAIFECTYLKTPIISTRVGQSHFLHDDCLFDLDESIVNDKVKNAIKCVDTNYERINHLIDASHIKNYDMFFEENNI